MFVPARTVPGHEGDLIGAHHYITNEYQHDGSALVRVEKCLSPRWTRLRTEGAFDAPATRQRRSGERTDHDLAVPCPAPEPSMYRTRAAGLAVGNGATTPGTRCSDVAARPREGNLLRREAGVTAHARRRRSTPYDDETDCFEAATEDLVDGVAGGGAARAGCPGGRVLGSAVVTVAVERWLPCRGRAPPRRGVVRLHEAGAGSPWSGGCNRDARWRGAGQLSDRRVDVRCRAAQGSGEQCDPRGRNGVLRPRGRVCMPCAGTVLHACRADTSERPRRLRACQAPAAGHDENRDPRPPTTTRPLPTSAKTPGERR